MPGLVWVNPRSLRRLCCGSSCPMPFSAPRVMLARFSFLPFLLLRPTSEAPGSSGAAPIRSLSTTSSSSSSGAPGPSGLARQNSTSLTSKPGALPANLDDMKVGERALPAGWVTLRAWLVSSAPIRRRYRPNSPWSLSSEAHQPLLSHGPTPVRPPLVWVARQGSRVLQTRTQPLTLLLASCDLEVTLLS